MRVILVGQTPGRHSRLQCRSREGNTGYPTARQALLQHFTHEQAATPTPTRAAAFLHGSAEEQQRIKADLVSVAQFLLGR
jgi:hypothetical protein